MVIPFGGNPGDTIFSLIDMNGESGRVDGSLGLSIQHPGFSFEFGPHERIEINGGSQGEQQLVAAEIVASCETLQVKPGIQISIRQTIPSHQGLGSGTQTRLAILSALNKRFELNHSLEELCTMSTRGGTSGIGINAFQNGGLLIDGGHSVNSQKKSFAPSHFATKVGQPPLLMRAEFPKTWGIVLFIPSEHRGLSGQEELDFMLDNTPIPLVEVQSVSHLILMLLLPALRELDLETFGLSVDAIQDVGWKRRHWNRPDMALLRSVKSAFSATIGIHGCGLSSTGATMFGFFDSNEFSDESIADKLISELEERKTLKGQVLCTRANNSGMQLDSVF